MLDRPHRGLGAGTGTELRQIKLTNRSRIVNAVTLVCGRLLSYTASSTSPVLGITTITSRSPSRSLASALERSSCTITNEGTRRRFASSGVASQGRLKDRNLQAAKKGRI